MKINTNKAIQIVAPPFRTVLLAFNQLDNFANYNYNSSMMNYKFKRFHAFTLAEVLITLGIIGIVAVLTISTITNSIQQMVLNNQFKKFYSTFKQAFMSVQTEEGRPVKCFYWQSNPYSGKCTPNCERNEYNACISGQYCEETGQSVPSDFNGSFSECSMLYTEVFTKKLKVARVCEENALANGCLPDNIRGNDVIKAEKNPNESYDPEGEFSDSNIKNKYPTIVLQDGTYIIKFGGNYLSGNPVFAFDINGKKGPNKWGYDIYGIIFYGNKENGIQEFRQYVTIEEGGKNLTQRLTELGIR